jgi:hypothetical protein
MDLDLGVYHCQREEAILTAMQKDKIVKGREGIPGNDEKNRRGAVVRPQYKD